MDIWAQLEKCKEILDSCEGRVKYAGLNALKHISTANRIADTAPQMACFSAICAEEEAATSLLSSLRDQGYPLSDQYQLWSHENKAGVIVFIRAVIAWFTDTFIFEELPLEKPRLRMTNDPGRPALEIFFPIKGSNKCLLPRPPLDIRTGEGAAMKELIGKHLRLETKMGLAAEVRGVIKARSNERNRYLYASGEAFPPCRPDLESFILNQTAIVNALLTAVGLVDPWRKPTYQFSGLVEAALEEYVAIMKSGRNARITNLPN